MDRGEFTEAAYATIRNYFQRAAAEINSVEGLRDHFVDRGATTFGCTVVNRGRDNGTAHVAVHRRDGQRMLGDIYWSFN